MGSEPDGGRKTDLIRTTVIQSVEWRAIVVGERGSGVGATGKFQLGLSMSHRQENQRQLLRVHEGQFQPTFDRNRTASSVSGRCLILVGQARIYPRYRRSSSRKPSSRSAPRSTETFVRGQGATQFKRLPYLGIIC